jgi:hypothetical protein
MEINKAKVIATRQHNEVPGWHLHHTEGGRYWLDTAPGNDGSGCSELSSKEYESVAGAELRPYLIGDECVSDTVVYAASLEDALDLAKDWERDGSWDQRCEVDVFAVELDLDAYENGNRREAYIGYLAWATVEVGEDPPEPECEAADEHDWCSPHSVLGGLTENPGVWSEGGTKMVFRKVCKHCGCYRTETSVGAQRNPGELDRLEYDKPDEVSLRWVSKCLKEEA